MFLVSATLSPDVGLLYTDLRCLKVVLGLHDAPYILERPPLLDVQLGDCLAVLIPRFCHHL